MQNKYLVFLFTAALLSPLPVMAKSVKELWLAMPEDMVPYLGKEKRQECLDFMQMGVKAEADNALGGKSVVDTLTADYLQATLSRSLTLQMKRLPVDGRDSLLCVVRTIHGPEPESMVEFYSQEWERLGGMQFLVDDLVQRPDTMSTQRFRELLLLFDPGLVCASLVPDSDELEVSVRAVNVTAEEAEELKAIILQRKFKWNGTEFN